MPVFITLGRVLFALLFIASGASKLIDISTTAQEIGGRVVMPQLLMPYVTQIENAVGMSINQVLAIAVGTIEAVSGLMVAFNFGIRFFSFVLIVFTAVATFYFHDFWNLTGAEARDNLIHFLKNVALIGALFMMFGYGSGRRGVEPDIYPER
jgi:putative oxidoreductase